MKNRNLSESFRNAMNGVIHAAVHERNMRYHIAAGIAVLALSAYYKVTRIELIIVCITIALVMVCELFNTAVEGLVDIIVDIYHPKAKAIKDVAAGAVMLSALLSLVVGYLIFYDRLSLELEKGIIKARQLPADMTATALAAAGIIMAALIAANWKRVPLKDNIAGGSAAVFFFITAAAALWSGNAAVTLFCLAISLLAVQRKPGGNIYYLVQSAAGAIFGSLAALLIFLLFG